MIQEEILYVKPGCRKPICVVVSKLHKNITFTASNSKGATLNSGAGVYHRGAPGSGGFIAVKLLTYDYSQHVKAEPPPDDLMKEDEGFTTEISNKVEAN